MNYRTFTIQWFELSSNITNPRQTTNNMKNNFITPVDAATDDNASPPASTETPIDVKKSKSLWESEAYSQESSSNVDNSPASVCNNKGTNSSDTNPQSLTHSFRHRKSSKLSLSNRRKLITTNKKKLSKPITGSKRTNQKQDVLTLHKKAHTEQNSSSDGTENPFSENKVDNSDSDNTFDSDSSTSVKGKEADIEKVRERWIYLVNKFLEHTIKKS